MGTSSIIGIGQQLGRDHRLWIGLAFTAALLPLPEHRELPTPNGVRAGDLVFIRGRSLRSLIVRLLEPGGRAYSHVGLVVLENGLPFVIHADPAHGEASDRVMKETWDVVISSNRIAAATVFRVADADARQLGLQAAAIARSYWADGLPFDHDFDLATPRKLYCTELVWRAYVTVGLDLRGHSFAMGRKYLFPSDLIESGLLRVCRRAGESGPEL